MINRTTTVQAIVGDIRQLFHVFKTLGDAVHAELGITASTRAVLEALNAGGPTTVPDMARAKSVTRQHIQTLVDELLRLGLVELQPNPRHQRSPLVALTRAGAKAFAELRKREIPIWNQLAKGLESNKAAAALEILHALRERAEALVLQHEKERMP